MVMSFAELSTILMGPAGGWGLSEKTNAQRPRVGSRTRRAAGFGADTVSCSPG